ncbi:Phospholipase YtpA [Planctopirus ephydatiae]|uniref:Phospholipase YtpA n=1 Tax=Planctopirus ephydatiae TaxID=2528019 RepID=A0A518GM41_9PLAN|nr:alpha/beta hydrolase [Planctopirus ephydatiae]QDV29639.1 Phospholipase YtpA [Planctopirus ephydatiae]
MNGACWLAEKRGNDGVDLRYRDYRPDRSAGWTTLIVHGVAEHGGRYDHVSRWLLQRGVRVIVPDLRGHGRSGGVRTFVKHFSQYIDDLVLLRKSLDLDPQRLMVLGHSMGGLVATRYAQLEPRGLAVLALSSPLLKIQQQISPLTLAMGAICNILAPATRFPTKFRHGQMTKDPLALARRQSDPFLLKSITARWFFSMKSALQQVHREASDIRVPVKILQGADDRTVHPSGAQEFLNELSPGLTAELQYLPQHLHEILQESDWEASLKSLYDFGNEQIAQPSLRHIRPTG